MSSRLPPHDRRAEQTVLCGLMREFELVYRGLSRIGFDPCDLYIHCHRLVFSTLVECFNRAETWEDEPGPYGLWRRGQNIVTEFGGSKPFFEWIAKTLATDPTGLEAVPAAVRVQWLAARRRAIHRANEILADAYDGIAGREYYEELVRT